MSTGLVHDLSYHPPPPPPPILLHPTRTACGGLRASIVIRRSGTQLGAAALHMTGGGEVRTVAIPSAFAAAVTVSQLEMCRLNSVLPTFAAPGLRGSLD